MTSVSVFILVQVIVSRFRQRFDLWRRDKLTMPIRTAVFDFDLSLSVEHVFNFLSKAAPAASSEGGRLARTAKLDQVFLWIGHGLAFFGGSSYWIQKTYFWKVLCYDKTTENRVGISSKTPCGESPPHPITMQRKSWPKCRHMRSKSPLFYAWLPRKEKGPKMMRNFKPCTFVKGFIF